MSAVLKALLLAVVITGCASRARVADQREPLATIPFELVGEKLFLKAHVNGSDEISLQFDTGAGSSVIDDSIVERHRLIISGETSNEGAAGSTTVPTSANNTLEMGGLTFPHITFLYLPLGTYQGTRRDAVIGYDMLKSYVIRIDYDSKTMAFYDPERFAYAGRGKRNRFILWSNSALMEIDLTLFDGDRVSGRFMVDNGADLPLLLNTPFVAKHDLMNRVGKVAKGSIAGSDGTEVPTYRGKVRRVLIGGDTFEDFPVRLAEARAGTLSLVDLDGILGNPILKMYNITFDYSRNEMYWEPNRSFSRAVK